MHIIDIITDAKLVSVIFLNISINALRLKQTKNNLVKRFRVLFEYLFKMF